MAPTNIKNDLKIAQSVQTAAVLIDQAYHILEEATDMRDSGHYDSSLISQTSIDNVLGVRDISDIEKFLDWFNDLRPGYERALRAKGLRG